MWFVVGTILAGLAALFYYWNTKSYGMFSRHGIFEPRKTFPLGSDFNWDVMSGRKHFFAALDDLYQRYSGQHKVLGVFANSSPILVVTDLDLAKTILVKDFDHFSDLRPIAVDEHSSEANRVVANMLVNLTGDRWKRVRSMVSPAFTSGKLKAMNPLINKVGADLTKHLDGLADKKDEFSIREAMVCYTLDCISTCGFGVEANSFAEPDGTFKRMVDRLTGGEKGNVAFTLKFLLSAIAPGLFKAMKLSIFDEKAMDFLGDVVRTSIRRRRETKTKRGDLIDIVSEAMENNAEGAAISPDEMELLMVANAIIMFFAGFDTTATNLTVTLGFLAKHPDVQEKLHAEIAEVFEARGTQDLDYQTVQEMPYLDMVFMEQLRIYFTGTLERKCSKEYRLPGTTFVVPEGMLVQVPSGGIHREKKFYPDPHNFNPEENWSPEARAARTPYSFLSFGQGPRSCIGMRFALVVAKMALIRVVGNFRVLEGPSMPKEFMLAPSQVNGMPKGGVWCKLEKRNSDQ